MILVRDSCCVPSSAHRDHVPEPGWHKRVYIDGLVCRAFILEPLKWNSLCFICSLVCPTHGHHAEQKADGLGPGHTWFTPSPPPLFVLCVFASLTLFPFCGGCLSSGEDPLAGDQNDHDMDSIAGVLKLYFRGLEHPLFPKDIFHDLMACVSKYDSGFRLASGAQHR